MDIDIIEQLKTKIHSITSISDEEFGQSIRLLQHVRIEKGKHFVEAGKICDKIAFIGKGILRTYTSKENGQEATTCFCSENRFTTSFRSFITKSASEFSIQAIEVSELLTLTYDDLQFLYDNTKAWPTIGRILAEREYLNMQNYALALNQETAKEKYARLMEEQPTVIKRAPVQQIASYLGVTRETLSRIRNQVANDYVTFVK